MTPPALTRASRRSLVAGLAAAAACPRLAFAQAAFPSRPITMIVSVPAGSSLDVQMRTLSAAASRELGQAIVIQNQPGVGGTLAAATAARAPADGYTLATIGSGHFRLPHMQKVPFDPIADFTFVIALSRYLFGAVVRPDAPYKTLPQLIAHAKQSSVSFGGVGVGSPGQVACFQLSKAGGYDLNYVPYKGGPEMWQAVLGGHLDVVVEGGWGPFVDQGKLRALAVLAEQRSPRFPQVPTAREQGFDVISAPLTGLVAPKGVDPAAVQKLHDAFRKAAADPEYQKALDAQGQSLALMTSEEYRRFGVASFAAEKKIVNELGLKGLN